VPEQKVFLRILSFKSGLFEKGPKNSGLKRPQKELFLKKNSAKKLDAASITIGIKFCVIFKSRRFFGVLFFKKRT